jgi:hypothetical protein
MVKVLMCMLLKVEHKKLDGWKSVAEGAAVAAKE